MTRAPHSAHRFRIASRCVGCGVRMLGACRYRTCAATTVYPIRHRDGCPSPWMPMRAPSRARPVDYVAIARAIFGTDLLDTLPLRSTEP